MTRRSDRNTSPMDSTWKVFFLLFILIDLNFYTSSGSTDTINSIQSVRDGETIVSSGGVFELGFFSLGDSKNRYVGIWYYGIPVKKIVWVANRASPLTNQAGVLKVMEPGVLVLVNDTGETVWSSKRSRSVQKPAVQLLDSGNLVMKDADDTEKSYLWQSFDYPTDTYLPGMKFGWNYVTGVEVYLAAWKADDDPAPGELTYHLELAGYPQLVLRRNTMEIARYGPWNGIYFSGFPDVRGNPTYFMDFVMDKNGVYYQENIIDMLVIRRLTLNISGVVQRFTWVNRTQQWEVYMNRPADNCDSYSLCGAYGICYIENYPACNCLGRFVPKDSDGWIRADWTSGCIRMTNLSCRGDGFIKYSSIKLPDAQSSWFSESMTLKECEVECLKNCSCMAYTQLNLSNGSGCLLWFGDLVDIRSLSADGQDIYIRMASSEIDSGGRKRRILIASLTSVMGVILLAGLSLIHLQYISFSVLASLLSDEHPICSGYMSPEYAVDGIFSVKSDVFSFGVLVLEIVSGKRNRGFSHSNHHLNLLGHAWTLYKEERSHEVAEAFLRDPQDLPQLIRSIHVGLLCVQQNPEDRPSMSSVVLMLGNEGVLPEAKRPGFFTEREPVVSQDSTTTHSTNSPNQLTITMLDPR